MEDARTLKSLYIDFSFSPKGLELWEGMIQNGKTVTFTRCTVTNPKSPGGGNTLLDARVYIPKVAMTLPKSRWDITSGLPRVTIDITALLSLFFKCHKMLKIGNPGISWRLGQKFIWRILFPPHNITHDRHPILELFRLQNRVSLEIIIGDKKWSLFLDSGVHSSMFSHPKTDIFCDFGCKKNCYSQNINISFSMFSELPCKGISWSAHPVQLEWAAF